MGRDKDLPEILYLKKKVPKVKTMNAQLFFFQSEMDKDDSDDTSTRDDKVYN